MDGEKVVTWRHSDSKVKKERFVHFVNNNFSPNSRKLSYKYMMSLDCSESSQNKKTKREREKRRRREKKNSYKKSSLRNYE